VQCLIVLTEVSGSMCDTYRSITQYKFLVVGKGGGSGYAAPEVIVGAARVICYDDRVGGIFIRREDDFLRVTASMSSFEH